MRLLLQICLISIAFSAAARAGQDLVFNGDFETDSAQSPPPGWAMWGAQEWKPPANFTRDTTQSIRGEPDSESITPKIRKGAGEECCRSVNKRSAGGIVFHG